jgi:hypothetical protein
MGGLISDFRNSENIHTVLYKSSATGESLEKVEKDAI